MNSHQRRMERRLLDRSTAPKLGEDLHQEVSVIVAEAIAEDAERLYKKYPEIKKRVEKVKKKRKPVS